MTTIPDDRDPIDNLRFAEDAAVQLGEAVNFLEASDRIACAALVYCTDPVEALEAVVILQGRVRSFLDRVIVRAA